jgi:hypothetical protein
MRSQCGSLRIPASEGLCRCIFLVHAACDNLQFVIRQRPLQRLRNYGDSAFNSRFTSRRAEHKARFVEAIQSDLPSPVLPSKTFPFPASPNQIYIPRRPVPIRGALAIVTNVGMGCGGRGSVGRVR